MCRYVFCHLLHGALPFSILLVFPILMALHPRLLILSSHVLLCGTVMSFHASSLLLEARLHTWCNSTASRCLALGKSSPSFNACHREPLTLPLHILLTSEVNNVPAPSSLNTRYKKYVEYIVIALFHISSIFFSLSRSNHSYLFIIYSYRLFPHIFFY